VLINLNVIRTGVDRPSLKPRNLVNHSHTSVFDDDPKEVAIPPRPNEEPVVTTTLPWHSRTLASLTIYSELSVAHIPEEEFALLRMRLQQEWIFDGGFVSRFSIRLLKSRLIHYLAQS
jgi:hypothetical protein